jgi:molybdopterin synthase catalytic subunit
MFRILDTPLDPAELRLGLRDSRAGAFAAFEGLVRDHSGGRAVLTLEYDAFVPLAEKEGNRILGEAKARFGVAAAAVAHRTGRLAPGDLAVWVGVIAAHRGPAFDACRFIMDELKLRVPIWKRERYADGASAWINSATGESRQ